MVINRGYITYTLYVGVSFSLAFILQMAYVILMQGCTFDIQNNDQLLFHMVNMFCCHLTDATELKF